MMLLGGMFSGVLITGLAFSKLEHFYASTSRGAFTLPQLLHVPYGVAVALVVCVALVGFRGAEFVEARMAARTSR
jgi:hypothetical protein